MTDVSEFNKEILVLKESIEGLKNQVKEAMNSKEEMDKKHKMMEEEEDKKKKKKVMESIMNLNPLIKEDEIKEKSLGELELIEAYETKYKPKSVSEVHDVEISKDKKLGVIVEKEKDMIYMSDVSYNQFNKDLMSSIYR